jgi:murein DD-endopeptidase MepM/ murein hydrolase activator NlpD
MEITMSRSHSSSLPLFALGGVGAFALASLLGRRKASSVPGIGAGGPPLVPDAPGTPLALPAAASSRLASLGLDFGRPVPVDVRAVVGSGWASPRGAGATLRLHRGLDIGLPIGTPILAIDRGVVTHVQSQDGGDAGIWTAVRHPSGITSRYIHLLRTLVAVGQTVQRGERIALSGDTATRGLPHLHLDLRAPAAMLPIIEEAIGRPRSGWGPEMKPFGHSIPGEPFVPVDGYRDSVRTEAAAMAIPLRDSRLR